MRLILPILTLLAVLLWLGPAGSETGPDVVFDVSQLGDNTDLSVFKGTIAAARPAIAAQIPGPEGKLTALDLNAKGPGPEYVWYLYNFVNNGKSAQNLIFSTAESGFTASGLNGTALPDGAVVQVVSSNPDIVFSQIDQFGKYATAFTLLPTQTVSIVVEGNQLTPTAKLLDADAVDSTNRQRTGIMGAVVGVMTLVVVAMIALISLRPHLVTVAGAALAVVTLLFTAYEGGLLAPYLPLARIPQPTLLACIETLMMIVCGFCLYAFTNIKVARPALGVVVLTAIGLGIANMVLAFVEPGRALMLARLGFAFSILGGFPIVLAGRRFASQALGGSVVFWCVLAAWALLASVLAMLRTFDPRLDVLLFAGLACVSVATCFLLVRFAFGEGYLAKPHLNDQVRRSLALAGARHHMWDWTPIDGEIDYDEAFDSTLGYRQGLLDDGGQEFFVELLHPEDRLEFLAIADAIASGSAKTIDQDIRLKNAEGYYQWFSLKARVLPGKGTANLRCIGTLTDISKSKALEERLVNDSIHDPVTGLPSRAIFMDRLERSSASINAPPVQVFLINLDRFKSMNDGLGHDIGDQLLQLAGLRIKEAVGETATLARMSGSQFAVMVSAVGKIDVKEIAAKISSAITQPVDTGLRDAHLTASIGISLRSAYGVMADELLSQAASALHAAQLQGPGTTAVFDSSMRDDRAAEVALESDLRRAIGRAEIEVHYQPIMQLSTLDIIGFEALARWRHPQLGLVAPENFISAAERTGIISELGQFVLSEASRQLGQWQRTLFRNRPVFVAVNVSATQFLSEDFLGQIQHILAREQLQPGSLKIEVTESVIVRYPERVERLFTHLRGHGIGLACDDFGAGFSSLSSLRDLQFDTLKMDRSFISGDVIDPRTAQIISTILELARGLGMLVVAEGIENQNHIEQLAALGCDLGQGFFLGVPVTAEELDMLLAPSAPATSYPRPNGFVSNNLIRHDISLAPPPGLAPLAPRAVVVEPEPETPPPKPQRLPSIFDLEKGDALVKKPVRRKRKAKKDDNKPAASAA